MVEYNDNDTWCINLNNNAAFRFTNYNFNSMMKVGDKVYGANSNGLYDLSTPNDTDDGFEYVPSKITTGYISVGNGANTKVPSMFISGKNSGIMSVKVGGSDGQVYNYDYGYEHIEYKQKRVLLSKGRLMQYYQFEITNSSLTKFSIDEIKLLTLIGNRQS